MKKKKNWGVYSSIITLLIAVTVIVIVLAINSMNGYIQTTGSYIGTSSQETLICTSKLYAYPFFVTDRSKEREIEVRASFSYNQLTAAFIKVSLYYDNPNLTQQAISNNSAAMDIQFGKDSLEHSALDMDYTELKDGFTMTLFAQMKDLNNVTKKYFMMDDYDVSLTLSNLHKYYNNKGFNCLIK